MSQVTVTTEKHGTETESGNRDSEKLKPISQNAAWLGISALPRMLIYLGNSRRV